MYKITIKDKLKGLTITTLNHIHHVITNNTFHYAFLWLDEEDKPNAYLGIVCTDLCDLIIESEEK